MIKLVKTVSPDEVCKVSKDLIAEDGTFSGTVDNKRTYVDNNGMTVDKTHTLFTNKAGIIILSADTRITSESDEFVTLPQTLSVDAALELYDSGYNEYIYALDVKGLSKYLEVSGQTRSNDVISVGLSQHHHEFVIAGTPLTSHDVTFTALIYVSGDYPVLLAKCSKDVSVASEEPPAALPEPEPEDEDDTEALTLADSVSYMTSEQKTALKTLKVSPLVTDLTGIEEFTSLESLDLREAVGLVSIDLHGTPVKFLNAENCYALEFLDCSNCGLSELNVSGCYSLRVLDCSNNCLNRLDVRELTRLEVLECFNQIIDGLNFEIFLENVANLRAWNFSGDEVSVEYDFETGTAKFSDEPAKISYDYVTGFDGVDMDVTIFIE